MVYVYRKINFRTGSRDNSAETQFLIKAHVNFIGSSTVQSFFSVCHAGVIS